MKTSFEFWVLSLISFCSWKMSAPRSRSLSDSVCPSAELLPVLPDRPDSALASTPITQVRSTSAPVTPVPVSYACSGGRDTSPAYSSAEQKSKLLRINLEMDLQLLRQCRIHLPPPPHLFVRGALDLKNVADELSQDNKFPGITKKAVRDRWWRCWTNTSPTTTGRSARKWNNYFGKSHTSDVKLLFFPGSCIDWDGRIFGG